MYDVRVFERSLYAHQSCIYLIKNTVKTVMLWNIITILKIKFENIVMYSYDENINFQQLLLSVFFNASLLNKSIIFLNLTDPKLLNGSVYALYYILYVLRLSVISLVLPHRQCDGTTVGFIALFKNCSVRKLQSYLLLCNDGQSSGTSAIANFFYKCPEMIIKTRSTLLTSWNWSRDGRLLCLPLPLTCPWSSSQCSVNTENALNKPSDLSQADLCWHSGSPAPKGRLMGPPT